MVLKRILSRADTAAVAIIVLLFLSGAAGYALLKLRRIVAAPSQAEIEKTNLVRSQNGVRLIANDWIFHHRNSNDEAWTEPSRRLLVKSIFRDAKGSILWEEDYYYSGDTYIHPPSGNNPDEMLTVHYDYSTNDFTLGYMGNNWAIEQQLDSVSYYNSTTTMKPSNQNTLKVADDILKKWGLQRF